MGDDEIAGRTVAAAKDGGLVLSKGHRGRSRPDGTDMRQDAPTRIGSDTRPLVAGPTGVETLARLGSDPAGKPLQGPGGVFPEERILDDRKHGVNRPSPSSTARPRPTTAAPGRRPASPTGPSRGAGPSTTSAPSCAAPQNATRFARSPRPATARC